MTEKPMATRWHDGLSLVRACAEAGITFIGPSPTLLAQMGDKTAARNLAHKAGVPTLPGTEEPVEDRDAALALLRMAIRAWRP